MYGVKDIYNSWGFERDSALMFNSRYHKYPKSYRLMTKYSSKIACGLEEGGWNREKVQLTRHIQPQNLNTC